MLFMEFNQSYIKYLCIVAVSVKLHPCGWAWLVCEKKVLLWRYTPSQAVVSVTNDREPP